MRVLRRTTPHEVIPILSSWNSGALSSCRIIELTWAASSRSSPALPYSPDPPRSPSPSAIEETGTERFPTTELALRYHSPSVVKETYERGESSNSSAEGDITVQNTASHNLEPTTPFIDDEDDNDHEASSSSFVEGSSSDLSSPISTDPQTFEELQYPTVDVEERLDELDQLSDSEIEFVSMTRATERKLLPSGFHTMHDANKFIYTSTQLRNLDQNPALFVRDAFKRWHSDKRRAVTSVLRIEFQGKFLLVLPVIYGTSTNKLELQVVRMASSRKSSRQRLWSTMWNRQATSSSIGTSLMSSMNGGTSITTSMPGQ